MNQWYDELALSFGAEVGLLGGGYYDIQPLTVTTYDSAYLNMDRLGNRFGLIVFDECHHLPGPTYGLAAICAIAPFRLGLTATPERADNAHTHLDQLIGPIVYRREITQLRGQFLADYRVDDPVRQPQRRGAAPLRAGPRALPRRSSSDSGIDMRRPDGWSQFLYLAHRSPEGREAFRAYREQRELALAAPAKLNLLGRLLDRHNGDRVLIFTHDNATVYTIARQFLVPVITHQTKTKERREILLRFNSGAYPIVATSRVLNEGVNVPEANVADHPLRLGLGPRARPAAGPRSSASRATRRPSSTRSSPAAPSRSSPPTAAASTAPTTGIEALQVSKSRPAAAYRRRRHPGGCPLDDLAPLAYDRLWAGRGCREKPGRTWPHDPRAGPRPDRLAPRAARSGGGRSSGFACPITESDPRWRTRGVMSLERDRKRLRPCRRPRRWHRCPRTRLPLREWRRGGPGGCSSSCSWPTCSTRSIAGCCRPSCGRSSTSSS